jgi:hypothetical protein
MFIRVDWENNAEKFWDNLRLDLRLNEDNKTRREGPELQGVSLRHYALELVENDEVCGTDEEMQALWAWLEKTEGWSDEAPEYAQTPLMMQDE